MKTTTTILDQLKRQLKRVHVANGGGAAWRARYVYVDDQRVAHLGIDPTASTPSVFGSVAGHDFRVRVPFVTWKANASRTHRIAYEVSAAVQHGLDGRYGWGTEQWRHRGAVDTLGRIIAIARGES